MLVVHTVNERLENRRHRAVNTGHQKKRKVLPKPVYGRDSRDAGDTGPQGFEMLPLRHGSDDGCPNHNVGDDNEQ